MTVQRISMILNDFERRHSDFHRFLQNMSRHTLYFSVSSHPAGLQVPPFIAKMKSTSKPYAKSIVFFTFQITRTHNYRFLLFKNQFFCTAGDPADPADLLGSSRIFSDFPETRHEAWCTTPGTLAPEVRMTVVQNKLPQTILLIGNTSRACLCSKNESMCTKSNIHKIYTQNKQVQLNQT